MFRRLLFQRMATRRMVRRMIRRRIIALAILMLLGFLVLRVHAQAGGGGGGGGGGGVPAGGFGGNMTPDQQQALQDQIQQMQDIRDQVTQNMQNAGVDPQAYMQDIQQQVQDGTLDMAGIQQQLVQKGFMTQQMSDQLAGAMNQLQGTLRSAALTNIQVQLNATDDEWNVLLPRIQKVLQLQQEITRPNPLNGGRAGGLGAGGMGGLALTPTNNSDLAKAFKDLQTTLKDANASEDRIAAKLATWRELQQKAQAQLTLAQSDLQSVLTLRQEAVLLGAGIL